MINYRKLNYTCEEKSDFNGDIWTIVTFFTSKYHSEFKGIHHHSRCRQRQKFLLLESQNTESFLLHSSCKIGHSHWNRNFCASLEALNLKTMSLTQKAIWNLIHGDDSHGDGLMVETVDLVEGLTLVLSKWCEIEYSWA